MIRLVSGNSLTLVFQRDHAAMSAQAAKVWKQPAFFTAPLWERFVEAVRTHDDGWIEEEKKPLLDPNGRPHDFKSVPATVHVPIWRRGLERAHAIHPYVTLLVASHGHRLYTLHPRKATEEDQSLSDDFLLELQRVEAAERERLTAEEQEAATPGNLERARRLLAFLDGLSLMLLGALPLVESTAPLCFGVEEQELHLQRDGDTLRMSPWPFSRPLVTLETPAYDVEDSPFEDPASLVRAMETAPAGTIRRKLRPTVGSGGG